MIVYVGTLDLVVSFFLITIIYILLNMEIFGIIKFSSPSFHNWNWPSN